MNIFGSKSVIGASGPFSTNLNNLGVKFMAEKKTMEISATVMRQTYEMLLESSEALGLSIGEMIDRLALDITCRDPKMTAIVLSDHIMIATKNQTDQEMLDTITRLFALIISPPTGQDGHEEWIERNTRRARRFFLEALTEYFGSGRPFTTILQ